MGLSNCANLLIARQAQTFKILIKPWFKNDLESAAWKRVQFKDLLHNTCLVHTVGLTSDFYFYSGRSRISQTGGTNLQGVGTNLLFGQFFPDNCMKKKEFGSRGGQASLVPP